MTKQLSDFVQEMLSSIMGWEKHQTWRIKFLCLFIFLFRAAPMAYGGSQARGLIRAVEASLRHSHSNAGTKLHLHGSATYTTAHGNAGSLTR